MDSSGFARLHSSSPSASGFFTGPEGDRGTINNSHAWASNCFTSGMKNASAEP